MVVGILTEHSLIPKIVFCVHLFLQMVEILSNCTEKNSQENNLINYGGRGGGVGERERERERVRESIPKLFPYICPQKCPQARTSLTL